jgi:formylglycine-generating enzyme
MRNPGKIAVLAVTTFKRTCGQQPYRCGSRAHQAPRDRVAQARSLRCVVSRCTRAISLVALTKFGTLDARAMKRTAFLCLTFAGISGALAACSFGVDLTGYFGGGAPDSGDAPDRVGDATDDVSDATMVIQDTGIDVDDLDARTGDASDAGSDASDAKTPLPILSCAGDGGPGLSNCGPAQNESCCTSLPVVGGTFSRSLDGVTNLTGTPATVSDFRLDRFETTVGRFRQFVAASAAGWVPPVGSGKHVHLNGGQGLVQDDTTAPETGWNPAWNGNLATTAAQWTTNLSCETFLQTWTANVGSNEERPIVCATWFEAAAFCIWDGGFLPSEAEWNYAASGGALQRVYPWSVPANSTAVDCSYANYSACAAGTTRRVGQLAKGDGKWGQADLAGNAWEWNLDTYQTYPTPCTNCASFAPGATHVIRGGSFYFDATFLLASTRYEIPTEDRYNNVGLRCARPPQ